jgi:hypothetical protein
MARSKAMGGEPEAAPSATEQQLAGEAAVLGISSDDLRQAAEKRRAAAVGSPDWRLQNDIDGLLEERRGYVNRGLGDRVAQVDDRLRFLGAEPPTDGKDQR